MKTKIIHYLEGNLPEEEQQQLLDWIRIEENKLEFDSIKDEWWKNKQKFHKPEKHNLVERINEKQQLGKVRKLNKLYKYAAAIFLLISIGSSIFIADQYFDNPELKLTEIKTDYGQMSRIILPDSSEVWINSGTRLVYNHLFGIKNRNIEIEGEAFFIVSKNRQLPFKVNIGELKVEVTGTQFSVSGYPDAETMNVVLEEGSVNVLASRNNELLMKLKPNQIARFNRINNTIEKETVNPKHFTSWRYGIIHIFNLPLSELVLKLEKRYNQKFLVDPEVANIRFTFSIENENLADVIKMLELISPVKAEQDETIIKLKYEP